MTKSQFCASSIIPVTICACFISGVCMHGLGDRPLLAVCLSADHGKYDCLFTIQFRPSGSNHMTPYLSSSSIANLFVIEKVVHLPRTIHISKCFGLVYPTKATKIRGLGIPRSCHFKRFGLTRLMVVSSVLLFSEIDLLCPYNIEQRSLHTASLCRA